MSSLCHNDKHSVDKVIIYVLLKYLMLKGHPHCFVLLNITITKETLLTWKIKTEFKNQIDIQYYKNIFVT